jgi:hypothetical protein
VTGWRKVITVLIGIAAVCAISHADMMPLSPLVDAGSRQSPSADLQPADRPALFANFRGMADLDLPLGEFVYQPGPHAGEASEARPAEILTDQQNSLTLCLYALLGLGLCRSVPLVKKCHLSCIPDWYHSGGPSQIGHSLAISPDCQIAASAFCFIQPVFTGVTKDALPQFHRRIVVSLWRQSQYTPAVLAPRGPPYMS